MIWWCGAFLLIVYLGIALVVRSVDPSWRRLYHPWIIFGGLYLIYSLTPLSSPVIRQEQLDALESFLLLQLLGLIGLAVGTIWAYALWQDGSTSADLSPEVRGLVFLQPAILLFLGLWLAAFQVSEGGIARVIQQGYFFGAGPSGGEVILYALATYPLLALIIVGYFARGASWDVIIAASLFAILNVLGGHRNLMMMEVGGLLTAHSLRGRRPSYGILMLGGLVGFAFLMFVGIYRGLGVQGFPLLIEILKRDGLRVFDPSSQELGTSFNVYRIFTESRGAGFESWWPGESYVRAFLSIVPRTLWPGRPAAIGNYFSDLYAPPGEGLGFSFNLEAYMNFGTAGVVLAMTLLGFLLSTIFIRHCSRRVTPFGLSFYGTLIFISFNLNRIDFQTVLKIGLLLIGSQYVVLRAFRGSRRCLPPHATAVQVNSPAL